MWWMWTLTVALGSDLKAGLGACDDGDIRGALEKLDLALVNPEKVKAKDRGDAQLCRARGILLLPDADRDPRLGQAAEDLLSAAELGVTGDDLDAARAEAADLLLATVIGAFQPGGSDADRDAAKPVLEQSLALADTPLARTLAVKATLAADLDAAAGHAAAGLKHPDMAAEDLSLALICLSTVPELLEADRGAEAAELIALARPLLPKMKGEAAEHTKADTMLAALALQAALADPNTSVADLEALADSAPDSYPVLATLGGRLLELGSEDKAVAVLGRAEAADPSRSEVPFNLAVHYINAAAKLVEADPNQPDLAASVRALMEKARPPLDRAHERAPTDRAPLEALVEVCGHLADDACVASAKKALDAL